MLHWTLYVHADPLPALRHAWGRPEPLDAASSLRGWQLVKTGGQADRLSDVATRVEEVLTRLAGLGALGSGEGPTLTIDDADGAQWEWRITEDENAPALHARLSADMGL